MDLQTLLLSSKIAAHQNSSLGHITQVVDQLNKGARRLAAKSAIMAEQARYLEKANLEARKRKVRQNKFLPFTERLSINKTDISGSQDCVDPQLLQVEVENASEGSSALSGKRKCGLCREEGHTKRTCLVSK
jgi:hypothetical protein